MRRPVLKSTLMAIAALAAGATAALAAPEIKAPAPGFELMGADGKTHNLSDYRGQPVVLEWTNHECPFVQKHYETGNMQATQEEARNQGAAWLTIISSAPGKQGHVSAEKANELTAERKANPTVVLFDETGMVGRLYGARTTPHMFVIDDKGILRYMGAIDDKPTTRHSDVEGATNYVLTALRDVTAGQDPAVEVTAPYGCAVKY